MRRDVVDEAAWYLSDGCADLAGADGRPLGEVASMWIDDVETRLAPATFSDARARSGLPLNASAAQLVVATLPQVFAALRETSLPPTASVFAHWRRVRRRTTLPPRDRCLPHDPLTTATFKVCVGFERVLADLVVSGESETAIGRLFADGASFFDYLDAAGWLTGSAQVCAGSRHAIERAYDALAAGRDGSADVAREATLPERCFWVGWSVHRFAARCGAAPERPALQAICHWPTAARSLAKHPPGVEAASLASTCAPLSFLAPCAAARDEQELEEAALRALFGAVRPDPSRLCRAVMDARTSRRHRRLSPTV